MVCIKESKNKNVYYSQLSFRFSETQLLEDINSLNVENMTPLEAIAKLYDLKKIADRNYEDNQ